MRRACLLLFASFAATLPCASAARAQVSAPEPVLRRMTLHGDLGYFHDSEPRESLDTFALRLDGEYTLDKRWSFGVRAGVLTLSSNPEHGEGDFVLCLGNPAFLGYRRGEWNGVRWRLGAGGAAPLAVASRQETGRLRRTAYNTAAGMSGLWDLWLWAPSRGALMFDGELDIHVLDKSWLLLELEPALYIPARDLFLDVPYELVLPFAATFGPRYRYAAVGLRAQSVLMPTNGGDKLALSLGPWLRVAIGCGFVEASYIANIGEPIAGARGPGIWGFHLGGGGTL